MKQLDAVTSGALARLTTRQAAGYAGDVIRGRQWWSGGDLRGNARRWSRQYAQQRVIARTAWEAAGGVFIAIDRGRVVGAVAVGQDDYGDAIYHTDRGVAVQRTETRAALLQQRSGI